MDQPTTRREYTSSPTAQYSLPSRVGCSVMSLSGFESRRAPLEPRGSGLLSRDYPQELFTPMTSDKATAV